MITDCTGDTITTVSVDEQGNRHMLYYNPEKKNFVYADGTEYNGTETNVLALINALGTLQDGDNGAKLIEDLVNNSSTVHITATNDTNAKNNEREYYVGSRVNWNYNGKSHFGGTTFTSLAHELVHSYDRITGNLDSRTWIKSTNEIPYADIHAVHIENRIRAEHNLPLRKAYIEHLDNTIDEESRVLDGFDRSLYYNLQGNNNPDYSIVKEDQRYKYK